MFVTSARASLESILVDCRTTLAGAPRYLRVHRSGQLLCIDIEPAPEDSDAMAFIMLQPVCRLTGMWWAPSKPLGPMHQRRKNSAWSGSVHCFWLL
jgi:hypothetical protein